MQARHGISKAKRANNDVNGRDRIYKLRMLMGLHSQGNLQGRRVTWADRCYENLEGTTGVRMERGTCRKWKFFIWRLPMRNIVSP